PSLSSSYPLYFFFLLPAHTHTYTLSLHDALPIYTGGDAGPGVKFHSQRRDLGIGRGIGHRLEMELVADGRRHGQANHAAGVAHQDRKSTRLNSSHGSISYAVFCLKKKKKI